MVDRWFQPSMARSFLQLRSPVRPFVRQTAEEMPLGAHHRASTQACHRLLESCLPAALESLALVIDRRLPDSSVQIEGFVIRIPYYRMVVPFRRPVPDMPVKATAYRQNTDLSVFRRRNQRVTACCEGTRTA